MRTAEPVIKWAPEKKHLENPSRSVSLGITGTDQHRRSPKRKPSEEIDVLLSIKLNPLSSHEEAMLPRAPHLNQKVEQVLLGP
jgi:hypothetical protein